MSTGKSDQSNGRLHTAQLVKSYWNHINKNDVEAIELFLMRHRHHFDMDTRLAAAMQSTGLHVAIQKNNAVMAKLLIQYGIDVNAKNKIGSTPMHLACKQENTELIDLLIQHNADLGLLDSVANKAPFEYAPWQLLHDTILMPLELQQEAILTSEKYSVDQMQAQMELEFKLENSFMQLKQVEMEYEDISSQRMEEWMSYLEKTRQEDDRRSQLIELNRTLRELELNVRDQRGHNHELHSQLEESSSRYQHAIGQAVSMKENLENEYANLTSAHQLKEAETIVYHDKLGIVEAMEAMPNDEDVQVWGTSMVCSLTEDRSNTNPIHWQLVNQRLFPTLRDTTERFPMHLKIQEYAIETIWNVCTALPSCIELCMQSKVLEAILAAAYRFATDLSFLKICVGALRSILYPVESVGSASPIQIKYTAKFCSSSTYFLVQLLVRAKSETMPMDFIENLCCVLFVLAKYNSRHVFLDADCLGLDTALYFLVHSFDSNETIVRCLFGVVSLLSIADSRAPEQDVLPHCYTTFGLAKIIPLIEKYAINPDIVLWGIRLLRNLAERDVVAKDQVNRCGIEHILSNLTAHKDAPALRVSILQLIYLAFTTNYNILQQVDELSTRVLQCMVHCLLHHEGNISVQEWSLRNIVISSKHDSNLVYLMESKGQIIVCLLQILSTQNAPSSSSSELLVWILKGLVVIFQHERQSRDRVLAKVVVLELRGLLESIHSFDERVKNLIQVLQHLIQGV